MAVRIRAVNWKSSGIAADLVQSVSGSVQLRLV
jgi:hypothetical protein